MRVALSGHLRCATRAQADRVRAGLDAHQRLTRAELGCLRFDVIPTDARLLEDEIAWRRLGPFSGMESLPIDFG